METYTLMIATSHKAKSQKESPFLNVSMVIFEK